MDAGVDQISFVDGDRIGECRILRRADGDRHCILSFFTIKRETGKTDLFVSGAGGLQVREGIPEGFFAAFMKDMRVTAAQNQQRIRYRTIWEYVDFNGCSTIVEDVEAMKKVGVPMWSQVDGGKA